MITNDLPGISATGVLRPSSTTPGAADLVITEDQPRWTGGAGFDNRGSRFSGIWTVTGDAELNGIFGADQLGANITSAADSLEQIQGQVRYRSPIGGSGLLGSMIVSVTHGEPGSTLSQFGVMTDSWAVGPPADLSDRALARRDDLARWRSHGPGRARKARCVQARPQPRPVAGIRRRRELSAQRFLGSSVAATVDIAQGLPFLGATTDLSQLSRPDGKLDFTKIYRCRARHASAVRLAERGVQLPGPGLVHALITGEQITYGGTQIGRGYDPGAITGDQGIGGSGELRYDAHLTQSAISMIEPYIFVDGARTWYIHGAATAQPGGRIASTGAGIRLWMPWNVVLDLEAAQTLWAVPGSDNGKQATKVLIDASVRF